MKIREYSFSPYSLKFKKPFVTSSKIITERNGFIVKVKDKNGKNGIGDVVPFFDSNSESLEILEEELRKIFILFKNEFEILKPDDLKRIISPLDKLTCIKAGIEQALLSLLSKYDDFSFQKFFNVKIKKEIPVNSVIDISSKNEIEEQVKKNIQQGFKTIKLKIGRKSFQDDLDVVQSIHNIINKKIKLRLDVNAKWKKQEAINNIKQFDKFNIEYIEQPTENIYDFPDIQKTTSIPLAADESIKTTEEAKKIIENNLVNVLIIKPIILGGISESIRLIKLAEEKNIKVVITTSLDSSIAKRIAVFLSSILKTNVACGLSTSNLFIKDIKKDLYPVKNGKISFSKKRNFHEKFLI